MNVQTGGSDYRFLIFSELKISFQLTIYIMIWKCSKNLIYYLYDINENFDIVLLNDLFNVKVLALIGQDFFIFLFSTFLAGLKVKQLSTKLLVNNKILPNW